VSTTGRRRLGSLHHESPDAAREQEDPSTPSDAEALAALRVLRTWLGVGGSPAVYDQAHLPPDAKSADSYMRRHRELRKAKAPGVWVRGKLLCCTAEGWAANITTPKLTLVEPARDVDELDRALGIRTKRGPQ